MSRKLAVLALLALSLSTYGRTRAVSPRFIQPGTGSASGFVHSVEGNLIRLAGGLIVIDATDAYVIIGRGHVGTVAEIEAGMLLVAQIRSDLPPSAPATLRAGTITASHAGDAGLFGAVQGVDMTARTLTVLGHTIHVDDDTSFGGVLRHDGVPSLADIVPGQLVNVQVDNVNGQLLARDVLVMSPVPPQIQRIRGTVKAIGTDRWTIDSDNGEMAFIVNAQTKITGSPKVGDLVEVVYNVDTANGNVAIAIYRVHIPPPPPPIVRSTGTVKSLDATKLVLTSHGLDVSFAVNERTKFSPPNIGAGDDVIVLSTIQGRVLTALSVVKQDS
jgi:hypothetical protein